MENERIFNISSVVDVSKFTKDEYSLEEEAEYYFFRLQYPDGHVEYVNYTSPALYVRDIFSGLIAHQISKEYGCPDVEPCALEEYAASAIAGTEIDSSESPAKILDWKMFPDAPEEFREAIRYLNSAYSSRDSEEMRLFLHKAMLRLTLLKF